MSPPKRIQIGARVSIYRRGKKGAWTADFHWRGKHARKSLKTAVERIARSKAARIESELDAGVYSDVDRKLASKAHKPAVALVEAVRLFLEAKQREDVAKKTFGKYQSTLRVFQAFCDSVNVKTVDSISLLIYDKFRAQRRETRAAKTVFNDFRIVAPFLDWCLRREIILKNPLAGEQLDRPRYIPRGGPTLPQVNQILTEFSGDKRVALEILAFAGMRAGECRRLRFDLGDVDLAGNWIRVECREGAETKTRDSWKVPIHLRLRKTLERVSKQKRRWFLTAPPSSKRRVTGDFAINMDRLNDEFKEVLQRLGIRAGKKTADGFTLHSLRSFFKTFCVNNGIPREIVDAWQNHKGDRRPTASDAYYRLSDEVSQEKMKLVPFGDG